MLLALFCLALTSTALTAQIDFQEITNAGLPAVGQGSSSFADVDNDGDTDIFISGNISGTYIARIYLNNGNGDFTMSSNTLTGVAAKSSSLFLDIDNDGDQDLIYCGRNEGFAIETNLYVNDGNGNFLEDNNSNFTDLYSGDIAATDIDNDNDLDIVLTGAGTVALTTELYINNGNGTFTLSTQNLQPVSVSSVDFADFDNDGDPDLLLFGANQSFYGLLYLNDGNGNFSLQANSNIQGFAFSATTVEDFNNDGFQDFIVSGRIDNNFTKATTYYQNNGDATFSAVSGVNLIGVEAGSINSTDFNNDGNKDIILTGLTNANVSATKIYLGQPINSFTEFSIPALPQAYNRGHQLVTDLDNDSDIDLVIIGSDFTSIQTFAKAFRNVSISCLAPNNLTASNLSTTTADLSWDAAASESDGYDYVLITDGTIPDASTTPTGSVTNGVTTVNLTGLTPATYYEAYVRTNCGAGDLSDWSEVASFTTFPTCGDNYFDNGGPSGNYANNSNETITISPINSGDVVSVEFLSFNVESDFDFLFIYDGPDTSSPAISSGYFNDGWNGTGSFSAEGETFISTHSSGSLTFVFTSDSSISLSGWEALVTCALPITCITPENLSVSSVTSSSADLSWDAGAGETDGYDYVLITDGTTPDASTTPSGSVNTGETLVNLTGLTSATSYDAYVRTKCNGGELSEWSVVLNFQTTVDGSGLFTEVTGTTFDGVNFSSIAFDDVDGDGDEDVFITGTKVGGLRIAKLYTNDGSGNFLEVSGTPFNGMNDGSIAFADVDGDGDKDLLVTGKISNTQRIAKLYANDGNGNFSEVSGTPFDAVNRSSIAFADVDGDGDKDVLFTGAINDSFQSISKLYTNDGNGNFSEVSGTPFDEVNDGSIAFADVDGDGDRDVMITGFNSSNQSITKLYINDGSGNFSEALGAIFEPVRGKGVIVFSDVDADGDQDVLISGLGSSSIGNITKLYTNDGSGNFSEVTSTPFVGVQRNSVDFADVDADGDQDVLITGINNSNQRIAKLYANDGSGNFSEVSGTPFIGVAFGSIAFADVDGDGDQDVLITGTNSSQITTKLYTNNTFLACNAPANLTASNITTTTADLSWDAAASESEGYDYVLITDDTTPDASTTPSGSGATGETSVNLTGLTEATAYDIYVRTNCGSGELSDWSVPESFTTIDPNAFTQEYFVPLSDLTGATGNCDGTGNNYYGSPNIGFQWTDTISPEASLVSVAIEYNMGVSCGNTSATPTLNNEPQTSVSWNAGCFCAPTAAQQSYIVHDLNNNDYNLNTVNSYNIPVTNLTGFNNQPSSL